MCCARRVCSLALDELFPPQAAQAAMVQDPLGIERSIPDTKHRNSLSQTFFPVGFDRYAATWTHHILVSAKGTDNAVFGCP